MAEQGEPREPTPAEAREDSRKRLEEMVAWSTGAAVSDRNVVRDEERCFSVQAVSSGCPVSRACLRSGVRSLRKWKTAVGACLALTIR